MDGLLTRRQTAGIAAVAYVLGIASGLAIAAFREPRVLALGVLGIAAAFFYHAPPLRLSYRGLGEITVGLCYGPLLTAGTYLVQRGEIPREVLWISLPLGILIADFLLINEFPDSSADARCGKRTLVVRLGRQRASVLFGVIAGAAYAFLLCLPLLGAGRGVWLGIIGVFPAIRAGRVLRAHPDQTPRIVPAQALTLLSFLLLSLGSGLGLLLLR